MTAPAADRPFDEIIVMCKEQTAKGGWVFQKFTCGGCGRRQEMKVPNALYTHGTCEECSAVTDIKARGCGFTLVMSSDPTWMVKEGVCQPPLNPEGLTIVNTPPELMPE